MVPPTITEELTQEVKSYVRSLIPESTAFDEYYPEVVLSYATGLRRVAVSRTAQAQVQACIMRLVSSESSTSAACNASAGCTFQLGGTGRSSCCV